MTITPAEALVALQPWIAKHQRTAWQPDMSSSDNPTPTGSAFMASPYFCMAKSGRPAQLPKSTLVHADNSLVRGASSIPRTGTTLTF